MGLNKSYGNIRSNVLAKRPAITVTEDYAIVTQKESQRTLGVTYTFKDPLTMLVGKGHEFRPKRPGLVCDYCGYKGHLKENCFKIVGYLSNFKSKKKGQNTGGRTYVNNATTEEKQGFYNGKVMRIGRENSGLHLIKENLPIAAASFLKENGETTLWHLRLGHASTKSMQHILELKNKIHAREQDNCEVCPLARQCRLQFPVSSIRSSSYFQLVHMDVWGPHKVPTYDRKLYFVTIVDDIAGLLGCT
uniref:Uncharacterized protein LOC104211777 n=1 Tax=Nicotiana sylvestris TaxID=4096 RepID=A0A1U7UT04_NICSY|nr:PREDICTED: uncharacterized protein LOC104211777 [Nicotiana sylvestris]